jgi:hypothetical protein
MVAYQPKGPYTMLRLDDPKWSTYVGGQQLAYDASKVLRWPLEGQASDRADTRIATTHGQRDCSHPTNPGCE